MFHIWDKYFFFQIYFNSGLLTRRVINGKGNGGSVKSFLHYIEGTFMYLHVTLKSAYLKASFTNSGKCEFLLKWQKQ